MIGYLDTFVLMPLLVREPRSAACRRFWNDADAVVSSRLIFVETAAALAQAERVAQLTTSAHAACLAELEPLWSETTVVDVDDVLVHRAAEIARQFALRGYDAVHCASAEQVSDDDLVAASGDRSLLAAWVDLGLATNDTNDQANINV